MAAASTPNILFVVFDAARYENFSINGYARRTTPNLERYASRLAIYDRCISAAMWTLPSTAGLFTGTYPSRHRLVIDGDQLGPEFRTLPELLRDRGYFTAKITGVVPYVTAFSGLNRGFEHEFEPAARGPRRWWRRYQRRKAAERGHERREGLDLGLGLEAEMAGAGRPSMKKRLRYWATGLWDVGARGCVDHALELWNSTDRPKFFYLHWQETHADYRPPHRYRRRFLPDRLRRYDLSSICQRPNPHDVGLVTLTQDDYDALTALYDACIAYLDEQVGRILDALARRPDFDETMIVITADHGDCVGRHGVLGHQFVLYDELIRLPLFIKWPSSIGLTGRREELIQNVDHLPTLCGLLGLEVPDQCEGLNFLESRRDVAYAELLKPFGVAAVKQGLHDKAPHLRRAVLAARSQRAKLIAYSNDQPDELYDLANDPRERHNLLNASIPAELQQEADRLRAALEAWRPRWTEAARWVDGRIFGAGEKNEIAPEVEARLRALGYID